MDLVPFYRKPIQEIHVDRRVVGWFAGRHVDHPCWGQISPWPARRVTNFSQFFPQSFGSFSQFSSVFSQFQSSLVGFKQARSFFTDREGG